MSTPSEMLRTAIRRIIDALPTDRRLPFHALVSALIIENRFTFDLPSLPAPLLDALEAATSDNVLDEKKAAAALEQIRRHFFGDSTQPLPLVVCPDLGKKPRNRQEVCCLITEGAKAGCDSGAGTLYRAKTNGVKIWLAHTVGSPSGRKEFDFFGFPTNGSERVFALLHEFGHILYLTPSTKLQFDKLRAFYWLAAQELTQEERLTRFFAAEEDDHELAASMFALVAMRKDIFQ